ncbi:MAG TPA: hypothetical protein VF595_04435 [Tepidisphaeraceae bacterium]|jgi:hypothetical protein
MTPAYAYRPPNPPARRAGVLLLVLGGLALLLGGMLVIAGVSLPSLMQDPAIRARVDELRRQIPVDPQVVFIAYGVALSLYAIIALTLGLLVRGGGRVVLILTLIGAAMVGAMATFAAVVSVAGGEVAGALLPAAVAAAHAMIVKWTIDALRRTPFTAAYVPTPYQPMQAYYLPAVKPETVHGFSAR